MHYLTLAIVCRNDINGLIRTRVCIDAQIANRDDVEVIVVDGESQKDWTSNFLKSLPKIDFSDHPIDKWVSEPDNGVYDAMNKAAKMASSPFIIYINAGDELYNSSSIKNLINSIKSYPNADFICGNYSFIDKDGIENVQHLRQHPVISWGMVERGNLNNRYMHGVPLHNSTAIRTSIIREIPYNWKEFLISGDVEQMLRAWRMGYRNWQICPAIICRFYSGGLSSKRRLRVIAEMTKLFKAATLPGNKSKIRSYLRSALDNEIGAAIREKTLFKDLWDVFQIWPVSTVKIVLEKLKPEARFKKGRGPDNIVNLSNNLDAVKRGFAEARNTPNPPKFYAIPETANIIKCFAGATIININETKTPLVGTTLLIIDDLSVFTNSFNYRLYSLGVKTHYFLMNSRIERGNIKKPNRIGVSESGEVVYKL